MFKNKLHVVIMDPTDADRIRDLEYHCTRNNGTYYGGDEHSWQRYTKQMPVLGSLTVNEAMHTIQFVPAEPLLPSQTYGIILQHYASGISNIANGCHSDVVIPFTTLPAIRAPAAPDATRALQVPAPDQRARLDSELERLISNEMQCPICADLLLEPHMVCSNQHNLCQDCLGSLLESRINRCPECREIITSISRNRFACKAVEVLASMKLGTAMVEERMERKSGFENRQLDLDRLLAAIPASPSPSDVSSEHDSESDLAPLARSTWARRAFSPPISPPISPREYGSSLRAILLNDTLAPTGDQEALDRIRDVQRRRDSEMELRHGLREEARDSPSRWARDTWGQRPREVGSRVEDSTRSRGSFRTTLCRFYSTPRGCMRGEMCTFAHGVAQLRETETDRVF